MNQNLEEVSKQFYSARDFLYLGRGVCYPVALEGALKLKEISYIHAEGYPAGEMKHGPIALIDKEMPVVITLQRANKQFEKTLSNLREVQSREGRIIAVTDSDRADDLREVCEHVLEVPFLHDLLSPILLTVPLQLIAYYVAVLNGTDVDLPRNLAKSVTVE
ncbi:MAG: SIS domain-containing protein [Bdellovibrionales bacterium]|nr:SIS domain-containing protein [Bdellovibrionales bacterium]